MTHEPRSASDLTALVDGIVSTLDGNPTRRP